MADENVAHLVVSSLGGDVADADDLAEQFRLELRENGFDVTRPSPGTGPAGAKGDALGWAQLVVSFSGGLPTLVAAIRAFTDRDRASTVTITVDDDTIEITAPTTRQQQQLVDTWLEHQASKDRRRTS